MKRLMTWTRAACAGALLWMAGAAAAEPETEPVTAAAELAFWLGDFDALERQNADVRKPGHFSVDGSSELELFRAGAARIFGYDPPQRESYMRELEALTLRWAETRPASALAHILYANALVEHGWGYRGYGPASDTPPQAWQDFAVYLKRAADYLQAHADIAFTDGYAHITLLRIGRGLGWDRKQMAAIAQDGLKRNPQDVDLYFHMVNSLLPKWGGSEAGLDAYIRQAAEQTRALYGKGMYARLYSYAAQAQYSHRLFDDSPADWPTMKQGYEDLLARFPDSLTLRNRYAYMACLAQDKATLQRQLEQAGDGVDASQWGPNGQRSLEGCQRLIRQP